MKNFNIQRSLFVILTMLIFQISIKADIVDDLVQKALEGNGLYSHRIVKYRKDLIPKFDKIIEESESLADKEVIIDFLCEVGEYDPDLIFTRERLDTISKFLLTENDDSFLSMISNFIDKAVEYNKISSKDKEAIIIRLMEGFKKIHNEWLLKTLVRLSPDNKKLREVISNVKNKIDYSEYNYFMALAGDEEALKKRIAKLEFGNLSNSEQLYDQRLSIFETLEEIKDCRTISPLIELLQIDYPLPQIESASQDNIIVLPDKFEELTLELLEQIIKVYPNIIPSNEIPRDKAGWLKWWDEKGKFLDGLDIRKFDEKTKRWERKFPVAEVKKITPEDYKRREELIKRMEKSQNQ